MTTKPAEAAKPQEAARPFWKMETEPGADSTTVQFYTPANQLVYQEKLPNKAVTLTRKHIRALNETMDRLTAVNAPAPAANTLADALNGEQVSRDGQLQIGTYTSRDGIHLNLMLDNPAHDFVSIELVNSERRTVYQTSTKVDKYHYRFNMEGMPTGDYQLRVLGKKQRFQRDLTFTYPKPEPNTPEPRIAIK